jgi:MFS family permease
VNEVAATRSTWGRPSSVWLVLGIALLGFAVAFVRTAVSPVQEAMSRSLALTDTQMALLQGPALAIPVVLFAIPLGLAIDRYSRLRLIWGFALMGAAGSLMTALASKFYVLFLGRCAVGLMATAISTTLFSLLADACKAETRGRAGMLVVVGQYAGMSGAFAIGGALLGKYTDAWRSVLLWLSTPLLIVVFIAGCLREPVRKEVRQTLGPSAAVFRELWLLRGAVLPLLVVFVMAEVGVWAVLTWGAPALARTFQMPADRVGSVLGTVVLVGGLIGSVLGGSGADVCQRRGGPRLTAMALAFMILLSVPTGLFALASNATVAEVLLGGFLTMMSAVLVAATALFTIIIPNELRGFGLSISSGASVLVATGIAPVAISLIADELGGAMKIGAALSLVCIVVTAFAGALLMLSRNQIGRLVSGLAKDRRRNEV